MKYLLLRSAFVVVMVLLPQNAASQTPTVQQSITVTADRGLVGVRDDSTYTTALTSSQLTNAPGLTLDDSLHQVAGFQLFRRTSSWTANPTTEGISLRGLGSTAASRTLVVSDQVPLNDPYGTWIHWNEIPALAINSVTVLRGGAANLYGSSAIGGVIDVVPVASANHFHLAADMSGATENTGNGDLLAATSLHAGSALGALSVLSTGGYIPVAPASRGSVDIPANVTSEAARVELRTPAHLARFLDTAFLRGNLLNEYRDNGTPLQTNGARLWRYQSGVDLMSNHDTGALRVFGSRETYRQSFSSIAASRNSEQLTKLQQVPTDEFGASFQLAHPFAQESTGAIGIDLRDIRGTDNETAVSSGVLGAITSTSAHQRDVGGYLIGATRPAHTQLTASIRVDNFRTFDAQQTSSSSATHTALPAISELVANPHAGITQYLGHSASLYASAFRAFRGASLNELYRTSQVGQQLTLANNSLLSERATGFEAGTNLTLLKDNLQLHADYFWTEVNRPISAVLLSQTTSKQTLQRQNLGQIRSRGFEFNVQSRPWKKFDAAASYQFAIATVTAFNSSSPAQANLTGNWAPEVPRQSLTVSANYSSSRALNVHIFASYQGREFDDTANQFILHPYARFDLSADRTLTHSFSIFIATQNLLNRAIDAGKIPTPTLAAPRLIQAGLRYSFTR